MIDVYKLNGKEPEKILEINNTLKKATEEVAGMFQTVRVRRYQNRTFLYIIDGGTIMLDRRINKYE